MQVTLSSNDFNVHIDTANLGALLNEAQKAELSKIQASGFSPEVIQALTNQLVMQAVNGALNELKNAQPPLPGFLANEIKAQLEATLPPGLQVDQQQLQAARNQFGPAMSNIEAALRQSIVNEVKSEVAQGGGSGGSGSWLAAIARALGKLAGEKAAKMVELSEKAANFTGDAAGSQRIMADNQAATQEFKLITETMNNILKTLGETLQSLARK